MQALRAEIRIAEATGDARAARRRSLSLQVPAAVAEDATEALIHNISERGLLLETTATFRIGEILDIELPHAETTAATVVWNRHRFFGCKFEEVVSKGVVSAALLRSPAKFPELNVGSLIPAITQQDALLREEHWTELANPAEPSFAVTSGLIFSAMLVGTFLWVLASVPLSVS